MKKLIVGNWKMNLNVAEADHLLIALRKLLPSVPKQNIECVICPSCVYLQRAAEIMADQPVHIGGQDCAPFDNGAHTGDISARQLSALGCRYVILGHSERRAFYQESSALISEKATFAHDSGLTTIICVGETEDERTEGRQEEIVGRQIDESLSSGTSARNTVLAYEPVWAIGTGKTATPDDVAAMHSFIRKKLQEKLADGDEIRILYGGSVKPENAKDLFSVDNLDGFLVGGASLKADSFMGIAAAALE